VAGFYNSVDLPIVVGGSPDWVSLEAVLRINKAVFSDRDRVCL